MRNARPAPAIDPDSHAARMLACLRALFKARGMRYSDVAALLGVSEKSIKRYMTGRGVSLPLLEKLCAAVGLSLGELSDLAGAGEDRPPVWTSDAQEAVLAAEPTLAIVFALLSTGWTAARILREGLAPAAELDAILVRLDRLGLIALYPGNRTRLRAAIRPIDQASDPLRRVTARAGRRVIDTLDLADPAALWRLNYARLGPASAARVARKLDAFLAEVADLSRQDMDLSGDQVKWYAVLGLLLEHEILGLKLMRQAPRDLAAGDV